VRKPATTNPIGLHLTTAEDAEVTPGRDLGMSRGSRA
jgi:hypothetical protein